MKVLTAEEMYNELYRIKDKKIRAVMLAGDYKLTHFPAETKLGQQRIKNNFNKMVGCYSFNNGNKCSFDEFKEDFLSAIQFYENSLKLSSPT